MDGFGRRPASCLCGGRTAWGGAGLAVQSCSTFGCCSGPQHSFAGLELGAYLPCIVMIRGTLKTDGTTSGAAAVWTQPRRAATSGGGSVRQQQLPAMEAPGDAHMATHAWRWDATAIVGSSSRGYMSPGVPARHVCERRQAVPMRCRWGRGARAALAWPFGNKAAASHSALKHAASASPCHHAWSMGGLPAAAAGGAPPGRPRMHELDEARHMRPKGAHSHHRLQQRCSRAAQRVQRASVSSGLSQRLAAFPRLSDSGDGAPGARGGAGGRGGVRERRLRRGGGARGR